MDKQIKELANMITESCCELFANHNCGGSCAECIATDIYKVGYRKIPEGAVVLIKKDLDDIVEFHKKKTRKETAEKFARLVEFHSVSTKDNDGRESFTISALGLKEILHEEFGIPYNEICKEITEGNNG